jgi:predicted AlkP superfamily phosphohydrolase/phosphomutase
MPRRLWIVGFDGATFDLILPWAEAGELPHLAGLIQTGAWGPLESTYPPVSFPAWSTLMTGVNPGRHGIFDFTQRLPGRYQIAFINATYRRVPSLWQRVSQSGRRVGVMGFPATFPPEPVNGFLISGFDAPVTTSIDHRCVHPPELHREIAPYPLSGIQEVNIGPDWHDQALRRLLWATERRTDVALELLGREPWDLFAIHYGASDTIAHHFWAFHDTLSPRHDAHGGQRFGNAILQIYRALDQALGRLLEAMLEDTTLVIVSDHGSGGAGEWVIHLNRWLEERGWLCFAPQRKGHRFAGSLRRLGLRLPAAWQEWAFRGPFRHWVHRLESQNRLGGIDWSRTAAFSEEVNTLPGIWLNLKEREPAGTVEPQEYEILRAEICKALEDWQHPETGKPVIKRAWNRENLYAGPWVHLAPDIILEPALDRGYSYTFLSSGSQAVSPLRRLNDAERLGAKGGSMNGSHRPTGILIMSGAGIQQGLQITNANLADVAPTVLATLGLGLPPHLDGQVLRSAFQEGYLEEQPPLEERTPPPPEAYEEAEAAIIHERLRGLGYRD